MATLKQTEANRLNSRKSTGPRSLEGKAVTCMNALQTGIDAESHVIRGEDPQSLVALTAGYHREYQPDTPQMCALIDALVSSEWLLRRLNKTEAQLWEFRFQADEAGGCLDRKNPLGDIFNSNAATFSRLQRRIDSAGRAWQRAYNELKSLRPQPAAPAQAMPEPAPALQPVASEPIYPAIGFVPQPPVTALAPPLDAARLPALAPPLDAARQPALAPPPSAARQPGIDLPIK